MSVDIGQMTFCAGMAILFIAGFKVDVFFTGMRGEMTFLQLNKECYMKLGKLCYSFIMGV